MKDWAKVGQLFDLLLCFEDPAETIKMTMMKKMRRIMKILIKTWSAPTGMI